ncbi:FecCD family ABC transporter permease [Bacillus alkalicellulosilyticus]|uniref:FecCD family ABC transporter permease n=1 Tax=Alkalihalobacterium alkalicellulosilyticum TaxID=1912214 RepID=UPI000997BA9C|nr:iron ABC transporter permease [Bacillus alkalicellulosilyticus]
MRKFRKIPKLVSLLFLILMFLITFCLSIMLGKISIPVTTVIDAFVNFDGTSTEHIIITTTRLTRAVLAAVIGASLGIAGALMQALTRNPLASPDLLGINAGALFFIVFAITFFSLTSLVHYMWIGFLGAGIAGAFVYILGSVGRDGLAPVKIVLAGAAITALFVSFTQGLLVINQEGIQTVLFWLAGSVAGRTLEMLYPLIPFFIGAAIIAMFLGRPINILLSGEDIAKSLGQRTLIVKLLIGVVVIVLAGGSVALGGAIGFIGLIIPHMVRGMIGVDYRWVIPFCGFMGASLLLAADIVARFIIMPQEMPIGVMTALIGTPFFIYIARKGLAKHA